MACEIFRETLLELDLDERDRSRVGEALKHLERCAACQEAFRDFDGIQSAIAMTDRNVEPREGWTRFEDELTCHVAMRPRISPWYRPLGVAAAVLIVCGAFALGLSLARVGGRSIAVVAPGLTEEAGPQFTPGDINHEVTAFRRVSEVYDGRAGWISVAKGASDVGIAESNVGAAQRLLLLRLTVLTGGRQISEADLMVIPGQTANLTVPLEDGAALHYRVGTSTDEPTHLALWLGLRTPTGTEPIAALSADLRLQPGQKVTAGELSTTSGRYVLKVEFARASLGSESRP